MLAAGNCADALRLLRKAELTIRGRLVDAGNPAPYCDGETSVPVI